MGSIMSKVPYLPAVVLLLTSLNLVLAIQNGPASDIAKHQVYDIETESYEALVIQYLQSISNGTTLVDVSTPGVFQSVKLDFLGYETVARNEAILKFLNQPDRNLLRDSIHEISISGYNSYYWDWSQLEELFLNLNSLETVHWHIQYPISPVILRSLESTNPSAKLYYTLPCDQRDLWSPYALNKTEIIAMQSIINSTNLQSLKARITYGASTHQESMRTVFNTLATCPNIRELDLSINKATRPWISGHGQPDAFDFRSNPETKFPALDVLKLHGYDLGSMGNTGWEGVYEDWSDDDDAEIPYSLWNTAQQV